MTQKLNDIEIIDALNDILNSMRDVATNISQNDVLESLEKSAVATLNAQNLMLQKLGREQYINAKGSVGTNEITE